MEQPPDSPGSFNWASLAPGDENYALALEAYHGGRTFAEIVSLLETRGLSPDLIPEVTTALAKDRAFYLLSSGKSRSEVTGVLTERGLSPEDAEFIARSVDRAREKAFASAGMGKWQMRSLVAGGVLLMVGVVLYAIGRLGGPIVPGEWIVGLLASGVLLAGIGGVYIAVGMQ
jgi:hypothetical protein